jgi:hypothetical protein
MFEFRPGEVRELRSYNPVSYSEVLDESLAEGVRDAAGERHLRAQVHPVLEPLKVRLITKGEEFSYYLAQEAQVAMHSHLKRISQFRLIGRPLERADLEPFFDSGMLFVSGDYKGATDGVRLDLTKVAFEEYLLAAAVPAEEAFVLRSVLYEHRLHYDVAEKYDVPLDTVLQKNGQLMGSVLSFPILCVINLVCLWMAVEIRLCRRVRLEEVPGLVNGDDIAFSADSDLYEIWKSVTSWAGFTLSVGKNYIHRRYLTINSELWDMVERRRIEYFNVGLLTGQSKLQTTTTSKPIWAWHREVLDGASNPARAHRRFLHYHKDDIAAFTRNGKYNLFISRSLGGLGFRLVPGIEPFYTRFQRLVACVMQRRLALSTTVDSYRRSSIGLISRREGKADVSQVRTSDNRVVVHISRACPPPDFPFAQIPSVTDTPIVFQRQADAEIEIRGLRLRRGECPRDSVWALCPRHRLQDEYSPVVALDLSKSLNYSPSVPSDEVLKGFEILKRDQRRARNPSRSPERYKSSVLTCWDSEVVDGIREFRPPWGEDSGPSAMGSMSVIDQIATLWENPTAIGS